MKNVLVLENVDHLSGELNAYLTKLDSAYKDTSHPLEVKVLFKFTLEQVVPLLKWADTLVVQTSLGDFAQLNFLMTSLLDEECTITEVQVMYLHQLDHLNNGFLRKLHDLHVNPLLKQVLEEVTLKEVCWGSYDDVEKEQMLKKQYFRKLGYNFDVVELYYNDRVDLVWHVHAPCLTRHYPYKNK